MASLFPDDPEHIIFIPTSPEISLTEQFPAIRSTLPDLGLQVSTGPVGDGAA